MTIGEAVSAELNRLTLAEASRLLRKGSASSVELTEACLSAIRRLSPRLNAFIAVDEEVALSAARAADERRRTGACASSLDGIPLAHKDIFFRPGRVTTAGSRFLSDFVPGSKAHVLERLDRAGAIDLGRLNLAEFCVGPTGQNDHTGHCRNPWDTDHVSGGSSSGSGAAIGARLVFGSIGSDTGGSIRLPAGICGVTGLKPSYGRVSLAGGIERCWSLDVFGPLARSVEDVAMLFTAIAGHDPDDPHSVPVPPQDILAAIARPPLGLRLAFPPAVIDALPDALARCHRDALQVLAAEGVDLVKIDLPATPQLYAATAIINDVEGAWLHRERLAKQPELFNPSTRVRIAKGLNAPALPYLDALRNRAAAREDFERTVFARADGLYLPLLDIDVPKLADVAFDSTEGADAIVPRLTRWTRWVSYLGLPALALPVGFSSTRLPVAAQILGRHFDEATTLSLGAIYQNATSWHRREPDLVTRH